MLTAYCLSRLGYNWRPKITYLLTFKAFITDSFYMNLFYLMEICHQYPEATSVSHIESIYLKYADNSQSSEI